MGSKWQVERTFVSQADGQCRWDYVYQFLVSWVGEQEVTAPSITTNYQEESDGNRSICPSLDRSAATDSNH